jgi:hypothetical protein
MPPRSLNQARIKVSRLPEVGHPIRCKWSNPQAPHRKGVTFKGGAVATGNFPRLKPRLNGNFNLGSFREALEIDCFWGMLAGAPRTRRRPQSEDPVISVPAERIDTTDLYQSTTTNVGHVRGSGSCSHLRFLLQAV